ncbi:hypothetical protein LOC68_23060 [Blastopirellula sp. JC732]|uniref:DUF5666 domain-containing protein n=1 Tax=Blastopirellula sediminis TaxID=2894196 RepID=A0A9X1MRE2_9BACT|nr:hypothetical protein [Blastopirellula sediminis]MCC9605416.1 hypothetical protein [Blastopirellula sediminis]MCC9631284.1 hypothetical protein [Blastopirellula sediminis]
MFTRFLSAMLLAAIVAPLAMSAELKVDPNQDWYGKTPDNALKKLAPESGFINDGEQFKKLWNAWRPDEALPNVDFDKQVVLIGIVDGPNRVMLRPSLKENDIQFIAAGTRMAGPGFAYRLVAVNKGDAQSVNGKPITASQSGEGSIEVTVIGKIESGLVAIGGETTGTTITASGITWELELGENAEFRKLAEELSGKQAKVVGSLERRSGVEVKVRYIVTVEKLTAAN